MEKKKYLIVYYSYTGNNRLLAEFLADQIDGEICPVIEVHRRNSFRLMFDIFFDRSPAVRDLELSFMDYRHLIFLGPLWAGRIASPLKTVLLKYRDSIPVYSFVTVSGGYEKTDQMDKVKVQLQKLVGRAPESVFELGLSDLFPPEKKKDVMTISNYRLKPEDLKVYHEKLEQMFGYFRNLNPAPRVQRDPEIFKA